VPAAGATQRTGVGATALDSNFLLGVYAAAPVQHGVAVVAVAAIAGVTPAAIAIVTSPATVAMAPAAAPATISIARFAPRIVVVVIMVAVASPPAATVIRVAGLPECAHAIPIGAAVAIHDPDDGRVVVASVGLLHDIHVTASVERTHADVSIIPRQRR